MELITLISKADVARHAAAIDALSRECFGERVSATVWEWAYLQTPLGDPIVTLCFAGEQLVGHYAIVPMPVRAGMRALNTYLSMTTMVSTAARGQGLFVKMALENYRRATELGVDAVIGFPNDQSAPGFRKSLGWQLPPPDYVATTDKAQLVALRGQLQPTEGLRLSLEDEATRKWRMARPGGDYVWDDGLLYKNFGNAVDLLYFGSPDVLDRLPEGRPINVLVRGDFAPLRAFKAFDYQFGGAPLATPFHPDQVDRQMCLSDVF